MTRAYIGVKIAL